MPHPWDKPGVYTVMLDSESKTLVITLEKDIFSNGEKTLTIFEVDFEAASLKACGMGLVRPIAPGSKKATVEFDKLLDIILEFKDLSIIPQGLN